MIVVARGMGLCVRQLGAAAEDLAVEAGARVVLYCVSGRATRKEGVPGSVWGGRAVPAVPRELLWPRSFAAGMQNTLWAWM